MDLPTRLDLFALGRSYVVTRAAKIDPGQVDVEGSDANIFVGSQAVTAHTVVKQLAYSTARLLLASSKGEDLDRYAFDRYRLLRKGASPAVARARMFRTVSGLGGTVPIGTKIRTSSNIEYLTTSVAAFGTTDLESAANVRATQSGKLSQVGANTIRRFSEPAKLFDPALQVTNDLPSAGGEEAEDDDTFRNRVQEFWLTARRGTLGAIEYGALSVPGVVSAQAIEALTAGNMPARVVNLYIADSSGVANDTLAALVRSQLEDYRAGGIAVLLSTSLPTIVDITLRLSFRAGVDTVTLSDTVRAAVVEFVNSLPVNGALRIGEVYAVLRRFVADGVIVAQESIAAPAGDVFPAIGTTLRTTLNNVVLVA